MAKLAAYVFQRGNRYYFKRGVPRDVQADFGKKFFEVALTHPSTDGKRQIPAKDAAMANLLAHARNVELEAEWERIRNPPLPMVGNLSDDMLNRIIATATVGRMPVGDDGAEFIRRVFGAYRMQPTDELLNRFAQRLAHSAMLDQERPPFGMVGDIGYQDRLGVIQDTIAPINGGMTLGAMVAKFKADPDRANLSNANASNYTTICDVLLEVLGEGVNVRQISRDDVELVADVIKHLPSNAKEREDYKGMPYRDIAAAVKVRVTAIIAQAKEDEWDTEEVDEAISAVGVYKPSTVGKYLTNLGTVFEFGRIKGYVTANPAEKLRIDLSNYESVRRPFPLEKLKKLFNEYYVYDGIGWLPMLSLFHGFRGNEIAQLDVGDVVEVNGIACIHIAPSVRNNLFVKGDKSTKSKKARTVPIHSKVLARGFLEYVERRRAAGEKKLFDAKKTASGNYYQNVKGEVDEIIKAVKSEEHTFHSFRHTFKQAAVNLDINESHWKTIGGWSLPRSAANLYGDGIPPEVLLPSLAKIDYPI